MIQKTVYVLLFVLASAEAQSCPSNWEEFENNCYYVNSGSTNQPNINWHDANAKCLEEGGYLASVQSDAEQSFLSELILSKNNGYDDVWIGLNQLSDRTGDYEWTDGSDTVYDNYGPEQPVKDGDNQCIYTRGHVNSDCFLRHKEYNSITGIIDAPAEADDKNTFYFGYFPAPDDVQRCEDACRERAGCFSFTFISNNNPDPIWYGECVGRTNVFSVNETDRYATSGTRYSCGGSAGSWSSGNCGIKKGYSCKKEKGSDSPISPTPTDAAPGYCPEGWIGLDTLNKCYKIVEIEQDFEGLDWDDARAACLAESSNSNLLFTDLASFHSPKDSAIITSQLQFYSEGYWIGYRQPGSGLDYLWSDNSNPDDHTFWGEGEPNGYSEYCVELWTRGNPTGSWNDHACEDQRGYICQGWKDSGNPVPNPPPTTPNTCAEGYAPYWYGCYKYVSEPTSWAGGEQACAQDGGHLSSIHAEPENSALRLMAGMGDAWIGFRQGGNDEYRWTDGWPTRYQNWGVDEPGSGGDGCVLMGEDGSWSDELCTDLHPYICKQTDVPRPTTPNPGDGTCPSSEWKMFGTSCYYFATSYDYPDYEQETWEEALMNCKSRSSTWQHPVDLVSIHGWLENEFLYSTLRDIRGDNSWNLNQVWTGLSRKDKDSQFAWSDGTPYDFQAWLPGEPNDQEGLELCVEMEIGSGPGLWNDVYCTGSKHYVCKTEMGAATEPPTTPPDEPGSCPSSPAAWDRYGAWCYLFMPDEYETWDSAHGRCKQYGGSAANLATIGSADQNTYVRQMLFDASVLPVRRPAWIGLKKLGQAAPWEWIEPNQDVDYTNWAIGKPEDTDGTNNCAHMRTDNSLWEDERCSGLSGYVCRAPKGSFVKEQNVITKEKNHHANVHHREHHRSGQQVIMPHLMDVNVPEKDKPSNDMFAIVFSVIGAFVAVVCLAATLFLIKKTKDLRKDTSPEQIEAVTY